MTRGATVIFLSGLVSLATVAAALDGCASSKERARTRHAAAPWRPPGETLADSALAVEAIQAIYRTDDRQGTRCEMRRFVDTDVVGAVSGSPPAAGSRWTERWTMDRCGTRVRFLVEFAPVAAGGTGVTARFE